MSYDLTFHIGSINIHGWYVYNDKGYLHPDGVVRGSMLDDKCVMSGYFKTSGEAQKAIDNYEV